MFVGVACHLQYLLILERPETTIAGQLKAVIVSSCLQIENYAINNRFRAQMANRKLDTKKKKFSDY